LRCAGKTISTVSFLRNLFFQCHRIGQKKKVSVYRLICANTYKSALFDRASTKLGLDEAISHTMDEVTQRIHAEALDAVEDQMPRGVMRLISCSSCAGSIG
jgi:hypothetical protein